MTLIYKDSGTIKRLTCDLLIYPQGDDGAGKIKVVTRENVLEVGQNQVVAVDSKN